MTNQAPPTTRRGNIAVLTAGLIGVTMSFLAFSVDLEMARVTGNELQMAIDAAAFAGASSLADGPSAVRASATSVARANTVGGRSLRLRPSDIEIGDYDRATGVFTPNETATATVVRIRREGESVATQFAHVVGFAQKLSLSRQSMAGVFGGGLPGEGDPSTCGWPNCGIIAKDAISMPGTAYIDSWEYADGPYVSAYASTDGGLCSNGDIVVTGTADVMGDVAYGPYGSGSVSGSAYVAGQVYPMPNDFEIPNAVAPSSDNNDRLSTWYNAGSRTIRSSGPPRTVMLPAGDYVLDGITLNGTSNLGADGVVNLYVDGPVTLNGAAATGNHAAYFNLFVIGDHDVKINGTHDFYGTVYAPQSKVTFNGTAVVYGQIIAREVNFSGTADLHYPLGLEQGVDWCAGTGGSGSTGGISLIQ